MQRKAGLIMGLAAPSLSLSLITEVPEKGEQAGALEGPLRPVGSRRHGHPARRGCEVSAPEAAWLAMLLAAAGWAFLSAVEVDACAFEGAKRAAWGWMASFATSSLLAALSFAALL